MMLAGPEAASGSAAAATASSAWKRASRAGLLAAPPRHLCDRHHALGRAEFRYRGERRHCLPGRLHVLHPDEMHDGGAGTGGASPIGSSISIPRSFSRRSAAWRFPSLRIPSSSRASFRTFLPLGLWRLEEPIDDVARIEIVASVADMLGPRLEDRPRKTGPLPLASLLLVRDLIAADPAAPLALASSKRYRASTAGRSPAGSARLSAPPPAASARCGSSIAARRMIGRGTPLAEAALAAGFADQSHLSRLFKRAYGLTPARWTAALVEHFQVAHDAHCGEARNSNTSGPGDARAIPVKSDADAHPNPEGGSPRDRRATHLHAVSRQDARVPSALRERGDGDPDPHSRPHGGLFHHRDRPLNQIIHMWGYDSFEERSKRARADAGGTPAGRPYVAKIQPLIRTQETKILVRPRSRRSSDLPLSVASSPR